MGKKAKLIKFGDDDDEDAVVIDILKPKDNERESNPYGRQKKKENDNKKSDGDADGDDFDDVTAGEEKRKRKRKRAKADDASASTKDGDAKSNSSCSGSKSGNKISGGSGEIIASSVVPGASAFSNDATVFIDGIPYEATEQDIRDFFKTCGTIKSLRLPTWQDTGRLRGYGHVEFSSDVMATKAKELDGTYLKQRYIKIESSKVPKVLIGASETIEHPIGCKQVFVKNIPYDCTEEEVKEEFKVCGPISEVRLARWGHTDQLKGFCYVSFKREDSAEIAVKKTGKLVIRGRPLLIDFETGAPKMGFKHSSGSGNGTTITTFKSNSSSSRSGRGGGGIGSGGRGGSGGTCGGR